MLQWLNNGSRMSREVHVRFCEGLGVQIPRSTHPYIRIKTGFVYLAAILDALSRRVIGYAVSADLDTALTLKALKMAIAER
jgi:transposase InsO family protein